MSQKNKAMYLNLENSYTNAQKDKNAMKR